MARARANLLLGCIMVKCCQRDLLIHWFLKLGLNKSINVLKKSFQNSHTIHVSSDNSKIYTVLRYTYETKTITRRNHQRS